MFVFITEIIWQHSVLEQIQTKSSYPDQRLPQQESLYPIGLKSAGIEIPHGGSQKIDLYKYKNSFTVITFKLILLSNKVPTLEDLNSYWYVLDLWVISLHAVVVFGLGEDLLFKSVLGSCGHNSLNLKGK